MKEQTDEPDENSEDENVHLDEGTSCYYCICVQQDYYSISWDFIKKFIYGQTSFFSHAYGIVSLFWDNLKEDL